MCSSCEWYTFVIKGMQILDFKSKHGCYDNFNT